MTTKYKYLQVFLRESRSLIAKYYRKEHCSEYWSG